MNDIINASNLASVITAICTGLAALVVWRQGGKLGDEAKHLAPQGAPTASAVAITNGDALELAVPLNRIADVLEDWWASTKHYREAKTEETLDELLERVRALTGMSLQDAEAVRRKHPPPR